MPLSRYIGIDPGGTTGIAFMDFDDNTYLRRDSIQVPADESVAMLRQIINGAINANLQSYVGIERFVIGANTAKKTAQHAALDVIGAVDQLCRECLIPIRQQGSAEAKRYSNEHLRWMEWFDRGQPHANDAKRHLLFMLVRFQPDEVDRLFTGYTI